MSLNEALLLQLYSTPVYGIKKIKVSISNAAFVFNDAKETKPSSLFLFNAEESSKEENLNHEKIASICKLAGLAQALWLNLNGEMIAANEIFKLNVPTVILLDCSAYQIGLQVEVQKNKVMRLRSVDFIFTDSIQQMEDNPKLKMAFWKNAYVPYYQIKPEKK